MRVLIVDDEPLARRRLARLLARCEGAECVGEAASAREALALVGTLAPELLLLDIDMPGMDGLALARALRAGVQVVFTTAHREHAVAAFRLAAVDYLLKPIAEEQLAEALARARGKRAAPVEPEAVRRLQVRQGEALVLIDPRRVSRFHAADKYVVCKLDGQEYVLDQSLSELEATLELASFMRVHRGELVNLERVRALHASPSGAWLELDDGQRARVGRRALTALKERLR
jgi:two-component system response regulator AlgR